MYRDDEHIDDWPDAAEKLGEWHSRFSSADANPQSDLEAEADFSSPRVSGRSTRRRQR